MFGLIPEVEILNCKSQDCQTRLRNSEGRGGGGSGVLLVVALLVVALLVVALLVAGLWIQLVSVEVVDCVVDCCREQGR